jgi:monothiol glutaredoxin
MSAQEKIQNIISSNDVVLFMKGTPDMPQCGFSMAVVNALKLLVTGLRSLNYMLKVSLLVDAIS